MNSVVKIKDSIYYFSQDKEINKVIKTIVYPKVSKSDTLYISILLDTLTYRIKKYDKFNFKREKAKNYDLIYNTNFKEIDNNILINLEISFVNMKYLLEEDRDRLVDFIDDIFKEMYVERRDLELSLANYMKYLEKIQDNPNQMGKILINDYIYKNEDKYLSYKESLEFLKGVNFIDNAIDMLEKIINTKNFYYFIEASNKTLNNIISKVEISNFNQNNIDNNNKKNIDGTFEEINLIKGDNQVSLIMIYEYKEISLKDEYILKILNYILGGSSSSKLFVNVREKESICYSISSQDRIDYGIEVIVDVDENNLELAQKRVNEQLKEIQVGNIKYEFENAKNKYIADLRANCNRGYLQKIMLDKNIIRKTDRYVIDNLIEEVNNITDEEIIKLAKKLKLIKVLKIA